MYRLYGAAVCAMQIMDKGHVTLSMVMEQLSIAIQRAFLAFPLEYVYASGESAHDIVCVPEGQGYSETAHTTRVSNKPCMLAV